MDQKEQLSRSIRMLTVTFIIICWFNLADIEQNMHWMVGQTVVIQQDGAKPHTSEGTIRDLELAGSGEGWTMKFIT